MESSNNELLPSLKSHPIAESLDIPEQSFGKPIGTLILCGQGPVQDSATKVKLENLNNAMPGSVSKPEANTWMRLIGRAAAELNSEGDVENIITSGKDTGGKYASTEGAGLAPTEAELMANIITNLSGREKSATIDLEKDAKNTLFNIINAANIIDDKKALNPNDPNLKNVWIMGSHFHGPRLKILASLFGFSPSRILSAENVLTTTSQIRESQREKKIEGFDRQKSFQNLIKTRLSGEQINKKGQNYFQRKAGRGEVLLDRVLEAKLKEKGLSGEELEKQKQELKLKNKLFIEEQKSAQTRMRDERRWVRGLVMEADYVLPYSVYLKNDARLRNFLLKFDSKTLGKYNIQREELESISPQNEAEIMEKIRTRIDPNRWSWQVVEEQWKNEEYPPEVKERFSSLGIPKNDIESLSKAEVPSIEVENKLNQAETKKEKTVIHFLRHAPTDWSRDHKVQGNVDTSILPEEIKPYLEKMGTRNLQKPDLIVVSELRRTQQTADALKKMLS
jgi:hypothetical protein